MPVPKFRVRIQDQIDICWEQHSFGFLWVFFYFFIFILVYLLIRGTNLGVFPNVARFLSESESK